VTILFTRKGADTSYDRPTGADYQRAGINAVMRYITDPGPGNKGMTIDEVHDYGAHGVAFGLVWELGSQGVLSGRSQGIADAKNAQANLNALAAQRGGPSNKRPIYSAVDFDITADQLVHAEDYFAGFSSVIGVNRTGCYGSGLVIDHLASKRLSTYGWWVKAATAWGGGHQPNPNNVHIQQIENGVPCGSGTIDRNLMRSTGNWGQSGIVTLKSAPKPAPTPPKADPHVRYVVKSGDTLTAVAAHYRTSLHMLGVLNPDIANLDMIYPGESIRVR
jgi:LysM repeat protein